jgi:hypothetical protein
MDIVPIVIPPLASYIISTYCPFKPGFNPNTRTETKGEAIVRNNVWPVLSGCVGFAWYFARNKAYSVQAAKATKKGTREAVGRLSKLFQGSHKYTLDFAFVLLIAAFNWWIYLYSCEGNLDDAFKVLVLTLGLCFWVIYLTSSYTATSLFLLTPLLLWLFFSVEYTGKKLYYPQSSDEEVSPPALPATPSPGDAMIPEIDESDPSDPDKANAAMMEEEPEQLEQFHVW